MTASPAQPSRLAVIKIGSAVLTTTAHGPPALDRARLGALAGQLAGARAAGWTIAVVSSGAVAAGLQLLGLTARPASIALRQAAAAAGQPRLVRAWSEALEPHRLAPAQVLLTADDIDFRARFLNARRTLATLLESQPTTGVVPILNENDSVAFEEIQLGDNDRLAALTAGLIDADALVILSTVPGLCDGGPAGPVIPVVADIQAARTHATNDASATGVGGMATKLDAAEHATRLGIPTVIAPGDHDHAITTALAALTGGPAFGTRFEPSARLHAARKAWIAHALRPKGTITIDDGAARALTMRGASLLPKGVRAVTTEPPFEIGAAVEIAGPSGAPIARGISAYAAREIDRIKGLASADIEPTLGYTYGDEIVHRDDLIILDHARKEPASP